MMNTYKDEKVSDEEEIFDNVGKAAVCHGESLL